MAAPNLINATTINGKTVGANLTSTVATTIINNPASSGKCLKVNTLNVNNYTGSDSVITIAYYNAASLGGTQFNIAYVTVPARSTLNIIDKTSQYYLEENTSIGAIANTASACVVTASYEDIS
jgi:hypothetical protein